MTNIFKSFKKPAKKIKSDNNSVKCVTDPLRFQIGKEKTEVRDKFNLQVLMSLR